MFDIILLPQINVFSATIAVACMFATSSVATKDGVQHCNDKMRGLIESSCKTIMSAHKQRQDMYQAYPSIVKRENDFTPDYYVEYLDGESKLIIFFSFPFSIYYFPYIYWVGSMVY